MEHMIIVAFLQLKLYTCQQSYMSLYFQVKTRVFKKDPSKFFKYLVYCSCLSVGLLLYDSRSIILRLARRKKLEGGDLKTKISETK